METLGSLLALVGLAGFGLGAFALFKPLPKLKLTNRKRAGLATLTGFLLLGLGGSLLPEEPSSNETVSASKSAAPVKAAAPAVAEIAPEVFQPITSSGFPKAFATWKTAGFERISALRIAAAQAAAKNPKCDYVELSELSTVRSSPPQNPVVFVECRNGERFYIGESDLEGRLQPKARRARASQREMQS